MWDYLGSLEGIKEEEIIGNRWKELGGRITLGKDILPSGRNSGVPLTLYPVYPREGTYLTLYHCIPSGRISRSYRRARKTDIIILTLATALTKATIKYIKNTKFLLISLRDNIRLHQCINNIISSIMM